MKVQRDSYPYRGHEVVATLAGGWMVLDQGYQVGGPIDRQLGCGTATYPTQREAEAAIRARLAAQKKTV